MKKLNNYEGVVLSFEWEAANLNHKTQNSLPACQTRKIQ
jgi:hypothetical protein